MRKPLAIIGIILMLTIMAACGGAATPAASTAPSSAAPSASASTATGAAASPVGAPSEVTIQIGTLSNSGESGTATLTAAGAQTKVVLNITGQPAGADQPAHIHEGNCTTTLNPAPKYPLTDVKDGKSETTVNASLADLISGEYAINVHKSASELTTYVACGDIPKIEANAVTIHLNTLSSSGESGTATLTAAGNQTKVDVNLTGQPAGADQPSHIHEGTCTKLNPAPKYPLTDIKDGKSETTVNASLSELTSEPYAINVHKSASELTTYVACGDLPIIGNHGGAESPAGGAATSPSGSAGSGSPMALMNMP